MAHRIEDFPVFRDAQTFCAAVSRTLKASRVRKGSNAYNQIEDANDSIIANMDEGFAQGSDDGFAKYLYYSKGSVEEVMRRLKRAASNDLVPAADIRALEPMADSIGKQLGGLIKYLKKSGFKDRGRYRIDHPVAGSPKPNPHDGRSEDSSPEGSASEDSRSDVSRAGDSRSGDS